MSIRAFVPGDRGEGEATWDVASILAGITLPSIEPFGCDNAVLAGLPLNTPVPVPDPEPLSQLSLARQVYDAGLLGLAAVKRLEDAVAGCKARLVAQVCGAAAVEMTACGLDGWQRQIAGGSTVTELALVLAIPERTAAVLEHHAVELLASHPQVLAGVEAGDFSFRHATIMVDEMGLLKESPAVTARDVEVFEGKLMHLVVNTTAVAFAGKARRARERMHPETMRTRTKEAFSQRKMSCEPGKDGMSWLTLQLPTVSACAIYTHCTRLARAIKAQAHAAHRAASAAGAAGTGQGGPDLREHRTLEQLRVDTATILLLGQHLPTMANTAASSNTAGTARTNLHGTDPHGTNRHGTSPGTTRPAGSGSAGTGAGSELAEDADLPPWLHAIPNNPANGQGAAMPATTDPGVAVRAGDEALSGQWEGDGSGYVRGVVDGIVEDSFQEYREQLETLSRSKVMVDPPLPQALVLVTVPVLGLLGLTDEPAELPGPQGGPLSQDVARKLLATSPTFLRVLTDPVSGAALPLQPQRYRLPDAEKAVLQALAGGCYMPNCPNPVMDTELDHLRAFEFGGASTMANLSPACLRHHTLRHLKDDKNRHGQRRCINEPERNNIRVRGWTPQQTSDGRIGWITPTGTYQPPLNTDPPRPMYPPWLKNLINKATQTRRQ